MLAGEEVDDRNRLEELERRDEQRDHDPDGRRDRDERAYGENAPDDVLAQPAFRDFAGGETYPGPLVETDEQIVDWAGRTVESNMHPTSTCRLGTDDRSVVDPDTMHVHGVGGLSVVDASAMPYCPNSATHAPTMMLAEKAADMLLGNTPLAPLPQESTQCREAGPVGPSVSPRSP